jgi:hypothetical protein
MSRYNAIRAALIVAAVLKPSLILAGFLCLASNVDTTYLLVIMAGYLFVSSLPGMCVDPVVEEEAAQRRPDDGILGYIRPLCIYFVLMWIFDQPEVRAFLATAAARLWDWRPTTVVTILCFHRLQKELRAALNFKITDLYPCLNRREKSEVS